MDKETLQYNGKIAKILQMFLNPKFRIQNDVYINLLLTHLAKEQEDGKTARYISFKETFIYWLTQATNLWGKKKITPQPLVLSFALNITAYLSTDEEVFMKLERASIYETLINIVHVNHNGQATVKLGFVNLLCSFLDHKSGLQWVMATNYWMEIIELSVRPQTIYIRKQGYQFVIKLLEKMASFNQEFCVHVIKRIIGPLCAFITALPTAMTLEIQNQSTCDTLRPTLLFITEVLQVLLKNLSMNVVKLFSEQQLYENLEKILLLSQDEQFSYELLKVLFLISFYELYNQLAGIKQIVHDSASLSGVMQLFNLLLAEMLKDHPRTVLMLCYHGQLCWTYIAHKMPLCFRKGEPIELEYQMTILQLLPVMIFGFHLVGEKHARMSMMEDEIRRMFIMKLLKKTGIKTVQMAYTWKSRLLALPNLIEYTTYALQYLVKCTRFYTRETAAMVFQPLVYCLQDCLACLKKHCIMTSECNTFMDALLECIIIYIETFNLTWKDSIETICVMNLAYEFLSFSETLWIPKLVVQGLKLLNTAISKYMSPSMALLMDTTIDSILTHIGPLLYSRCHNGNWEIRDSTLEVIYTISYNATTRFPAFQKILLETELPQLVLEMGLNDGEPFVRATGLRCLQEAILVPGIWNLFMETGNFHDKILNIFESETEGIVRKEAATLIGKIYEEQSVSDEILSKYYDVMTHAALADLHWEVKVKALDFWHKVVKKHLQHHGMIDGSFPTVTFSKENKKIVMLNEAEVQKCLIKILNQLSHVGCLAVFVEAAQDDCDVEVSKAAAKIIEKFIDLLKQYKITAENIDMSQPPSPLYCSTKPSYRTSSGYGSIYSPLSLCNSVSTSIDQNSFENELDEYLQHSHREAPSSTNMEPVNTNQTDIPNVSQGTQLNANFDVTNHNNHACTQSLNEVSLLNPISDSINYKCLQDTSMYHTGNDDLLFNATDSLNPATFQSCTSAVSEEMLDEITKANDLNLLQKIFNPQPKVNSNLVSMKRKSVLPPSQFVKFTYNEMISNVNQKSEWLKSLDEFSSLLDDILREYSCSSEVNGMDCY